VFLNGIVYYLNSLPKDIYWYTLPIRFVVETMDIVGIVMNMAEGAYAFEIGFNRIDYYNPAFWVGKTLKLAF